MEDKPTDWTQVVVKQDDAVANPNSGFDKDDPVKSMELYWQERLKIKNPKALES